MRISPRSTACSSGSVRKNAASRPTSGSRTSKRARSIERDQPEQPEHAHDVRAQPLAQAQVTARDREQRAQRRARRQAPRSPSRRSAAARTAAMRCSMRRAVSSTPCASCTRIGVEQQLRILAPARLRDLGFAHAAMAVVREERFHRVRAGPAAARAHPASRCPTAVPRAPPDRARTPAPRARARAPAPRSPRPRSPTAARAGCDRPGRP